MAKLDLDSNREQRDAARREAGKEDIIVTFGGEDFVCPPEMPFESVAALGVIRNATKEFEGKGDAAVLAGGVLDLFRILVGDERFVAFKAHRPSLEDLDAMMKFVFAEYGVTLGESQASTQS
jgi:hypothetical protein